MGIFSGRHFPRDIILWAVRRSLLLRGELPRYRRNDDRAGCASRSHHDSHRWVQKYGPELDKQTRWYRQVPDWQARSWRVDETYIRVGGTWCYLYRAIDRKSTRLNSSQVSISYAV